MSLPRKNSYTFKMLFLVIHENHLKHVYNYKWNVATVLAQFKLRAKQSCQKWFDFSFGSCETVFLFIDVMLGILRFVYTDMITLPCDDITAHALRSDLECGVFSLV